MIDDIKNWKESSAFDRDTRNEVNNMNEEELYSAFQSDLKFGTAGLRGILGAGTNRMNIYTVARAAIAICQWVIDSNSVDPTAIIGYDIRHMSKEFAYLTAKIMDAFNIRYLITEDPISTPELAFLTRDIDAECGIMVTASHNPREYNGYKVYKKGGSQILDDDANYIENIMKEISFEDIYDYISKEDIFEVNLNPELDRYINENLSSSLLDLNEKKDLNIVYTPFNGCGLNPVTRLFDLAGYKYQIPKKHGRFDPDFTTIPYPNPEVAQTFEIPIELAKEIDADIIIATDPDADRMNIAVKDDNIYRVFNGNEVGALLTYWICLRRKEKGLNPGVIVKTIVTDDFGKTIAESFGYKVVETLTGFKHISRIATQLENSDDEFVMGYEESIGYEISDIVRDKDGIIASLYIADLAQYFKNRGKSLIDLLDDLYDKYGYFSSNNFSITFEGASATEQMNNIMNKLRNDVDVFSEFKILNKVDYLNSKDEYMRTNAIVFNFKDAKLAIRPSGTEPKIKIYIYANGNDKIKTDDLTNKIGDKTRWIMKNID
ncbi:MAG: phospho-sugar mutase [Ezakiella sp.]|nr:phospho-sugar mutase [Bacillota bacterium]MDY3946536.1 phospho-sugar mutase [Ezakiella sp.]